MKFHAAVGIALLILLAGVRAQDCQELVEVAGDTFLEAAEAAGLLDDLTAGGGRTIFAPTDAAFQDIFEIVDIEKDEFLENEVEALQEILPFHVVTTKVGSADLTDGAELVSSLEGGSCTQNKIEVEVDEGEISLGGGLTSADVEKADVVVCGDITLHIIDGLLVPCPLQLKSRLGASGN